jgi:2-methylcitrate dehydratase PrpD
MFAPDRTGLEGDAARSGDVSDGASLVVRGVAPVLRMGARSAGPQTVAIISDVRLLQKAYNHAYAVLPPDRSSYGTVAYVARYTHVDDSLKEGNMTEAEILAQHIAQHSFPDLPAAVIEPTKRLILDAFATMLGGSPCAWCRALIDQALEWGGRPESSLLPSGSRLPAPYAAWIHSTMMHSLEYDAVHEGAIVHALTAPFPAALAASESRGGVAGRDFIAAVALAVDLCCRVGLATQSSMTFYRGATCGGFGATAAVAKLWGLDADTLLNAFGIVYSQLSGTLQAHREGASVNTMQSGFGAKAGVIAAALARRGITGPRDCFNGLFGYYTMYEQGSYQRSLLLNELGERYEVANVSQKPYPCGRLTHGAVELALALRRDAAVHPAQIAHITVAVSSFVERLVGRPHDLTQLNALDARLSLAFTVANAFVRGRIAIADAEGGALTDPQVYQLAQKVSVVVDPEVAPADAPAPQRIEVSLTSGQRIQRRIDVLKGAPGRPLSWDETVEKFWTCWDYAAPPLPQGHGREAIRRLAALETEPDIGAIVRLLCRR